MQTALDRRHILAGLISAASLRATPLIKVVLPFTLTGCGQGPETFLKTENSWQNPLGGPLSGPDHEVDPDHNIILKADGTPALEDLMAAGPLGDQSLGRQDAPVTMIEYASLTCPYCRAFHIEIYPEIKRTYIDKGQLRYILREFPIGHSSGAAAIVMRCAGEKNEKMFFALYDAFMRHQKQWVSLKVRHDAIYRVAAKTGLSRTKFDSCLANQEIIEGLKWVKQRGRKLGVAGTPTFFINGKKSQGILTFRQAKDMIEPHLT